MVYCFTGLCSYPFPFCCCPYTAYTLRVSLWSWRFFFSRRVKSFGRGASSTSFLSQLRRSLYRLSTAPATWAKLGCELIIISPKGHLVSASVKKLVGQQLETVNFILFYNFFLDFAQWYRGSSILLPRG